MAIIKPEQLSSGLYSISGSFSGSFQGDGSQLTGIVSSKWSGSNPITRDGDVEITGSLIVTGGITGSLSGTASYAIQALSASFAPSTLTIASTPIISGTSNRILYQSGSVVQQNSKFTYDGGQELIIGNNITGYVKTSTDNLSGVLAGTLGTYSVNNYPLVKLTSTFTSTFADGKLSLYRGNTETIQLYASSTGGRLTGVDSVYIKAAGALSTDIAFRVRNSTDNANLISIQGNNIGNFSKVYFDLNSGTPQLYNTDTTAVAGSSILLGTSTISLRDANANFVRFIGGGVRSIAINNGAANTGLSDAFEIYSSDISAGNAAPHFRTENGSIIKLYQQSAVTSSQGLADILTNLGFLTGSSTIATPSAFPFTGSAQITGSLGVTGSTILRTTGAGTLTVQGSGSAQPLFLVTGSIGELLSVTDQDDPNEPLLVVSGSAGQLFVVENSVTGSLLQIYNSASNSVFEINNAAEIIYGVSSSVFATQYTIIPTTSSYQTVYNIATGSFTGAFINYTVTSASNARAGQLMSVWNAGTASYTETTTTDIGDTSQIAFDIIITGSIARVAVSASVTTGWQVKTALNIL